MQDIIARSLGAKLNGDVEQINKKIETLSKIFTFKGTKERVEDLPKEGNKPGDMWSVKGREYVWTLNDQTGEYEWVDMGDIVDLDAFIMKTDIEQTIGDSEIKIMSQKAVRDSIENYNKGMYSNITMIQDYLFETVYDNVDYDFAQEYLDGANGEPDDNGNLFGRKFGVGGCSAVRKGNWYGRNFDWTYDESADFIVKVPRAEGRYASMGISNGGRELDNTFVKSGKYSDEYRIIPFKVIDGINEKGVIVNSNVVPRDKGQTTEVVPAIEEKERINMLALARFILDRFDTASGAVEYIKNYVTVTTYAPLVGAHYDLHYMVADENNTYIIEFVNNATVIIDVSEGATGAHGGKSYMTNFFISGMTPNEDGTVYTPATQDGTHDAMNTNGITEYGCGLERYNIIAGAFDGIENKNNMKSLMGQLKYTKAYSTSTEVSNPYWYTEFVGGDCKVNSAVSDFSDIVQRSGAAFASRSRDPRSENFGTWQTTHSCVYDIDQRKVYIIVQENGVEREFDFEFYYDAKEVDAIAEDINERIDGEVQTLNERIDDEVQTLNDKIDSKGHYLGLWDSTTGLCETELAIGTQYVPGDNFVVSKVGSGVDNLIVNGNFDSGRAGWTSTDDTKWTVQNGQLMVLDASPSKDLLIYPSFTEEILPHTTYTIQIDMDSQSSDICFVVALNQSGKPDTTFEFRESGTATFTTLGDLTKFSMKIFKPKYKTGTATFNNILLVQGSDIPSGDSNCYKPNGSEYTGIGKELKDDNRVKVNDSYIYDGEEWRWQKNTNTDIEVDDKLSDSSINPVQNKVITEHLNEFGRTKCIKFAYNNTTHSCSCEYTFSELLDLLEDENNKDVLFYATVTGDNQYLNKLYFLSEKNSTKIVFNPVKPAGSTSNYEIGCWSDGSVYATSISQISEYTNKINSKGIGSANKPVYVNSNGQIVAGNDIPDVSNFATRNELADAVEPLATKEELEETAGELQTSITSLENTRSLISETGSVIDLLIDESTYKVEAILKDKDGNIISRSSEIDLPLEQVVVSISFDEDTNTLTFTLKNGETTKVPLGSIVSGLASQVWVQANYYSKDESDATFATRQALQEVTDDLSTVEASLAVEITRATGAEEKIAGDLAIEVARAIDAEQAISASIPDITGLATKTELENAIEPLAVKEDVTEEISAAVSTRQETLVSGTNIKTVNNQSILGSGNIEIVLEDETEYITGTLENGEFTSDYTYAQVSEIYNKGKNIVLVVNTTKLYGDLAIKYYIPLDEYNLYDPGEPITPNHVFSFSQNLYDDTKNMVHENYYLDEFLGWSYNSHSTSDIYPTKQEVDTKIDAVISSTQEKLVSGTNIKTINGQSVLGSGDIEIALEDETVYIPATLRNKTLTSDYTYAQVLSLYNQGKKLELVVDASDDISLDLDVKYYIPLSDYSYFNPGEWRAPNGNFEFNQTFLYGGKNITESYQLDETAGWQYYSFDASQVYQEKLISGVNIKKINGQSVLGSGDIEIALEDEIVYIPVTLRNKTLTSEYTYAQILALYNQGKNLELIVDASYGVPEIKYYIPLSEYSYFNPGEPITPNGCFIFNQVIRDTDKDITESYWIDEVYGWKYSIFDASQTYIPRDGVKTINGQSIIGEGGISIKTLSPMKDEWLEASTTEEAVEMIFDGGAEVGEGYLGTVLWGDLPGGLGGAECKAFVISDGIILFELNSADTPPYNWQYNSFAGEWRPLVEPTADGTTTLTVNGVEKGSWSANQEEDNTIELTIPTDYVDQETMDNAIKEATKDLATSKTVDDLAEEISGEQTRAKGVEDNLLGSVSSLQSEMVHKVSETQMYNYIYSQNFATNTDVAEAVGSESARADAELAAKAATLDAKIDSKANQTVVSSLASSVNMLEAHMPYTVTIIRDHNDFTSDKTFQEIKDVFENTNRLVYARIQSATGQGVSQTSVIQYTGSEIVISYALTYGSVGYEVLTMDVDNVITHQTVQPKETII